MVDDRARRRVIVTLFALALLGATGLMTGALFASSTVRTAVQVSGLLGAIVFGGLCGVLAWRWWVGAEHPGRYTLAELIADDR